MEEVCMSPLVSCHQHMRVEALSLVTVTGMGVDRNNSPLKSPSLTAFLDSKRIEIVMYTGKAVDDPLS